MRPSRSPSGDGAELARLGHWWGAVVLVLVAVSCADGTVTSSSGETGAEVPTVLVFHRTAGFRHDSIQAGIEAIESLGAELGMEVTVSDDPSAFERAQMGAVTAVVFLNTTGDVLDAGMQAHFEAFIRDGGGYLGIHSAADTEYDWAWYGDLVGARFSGHPAVQAATVRFPGGHPVGDALPASATMTDEWYDFAAQPEEDVVVLAVVDEATYEGGTMGEPHPIAWAHEHDGGRSVYLGFGHTVESFQDPLVLELVGDALAWISEPATS